MQYVALRQSKKDMGQEFYAYYSKKEENIKKQREDVSQNLKRSADKMKETCSKKFKDVFVGSTVLIDVPKVDKGLLQIVLEGLY
ncbi:unnamed protein product [Parnassius apollo]|uniref:(apollo) hypothetical protein n=1 Tax=Parnassius apollo TaxID=110799 RepID=A0A8S3Y4Z1_PARAO|nr:unnamed protein product [Parnassius apollo]